MRIRSLIGMILMLGLLAALLPQWAYAGAFTYASTRKEIKVGILMVRNPADTGAGRAPEYPDPYTFYVMDMRTDLKPAGWEFINPLAPKAVTAQIRNRRPVYNIYQVGQPLTKNMAAYWEVPLEETSLESLLQFDLLLIHNHRPNTSFYPEEREKLRQLVDAGGQIWIEDCAAFTINPAMPFFLDLNFRESGGGGAAVIPPGARYHPLLSSPYWLSQMELDRLGDGKIEGGSMLTSLNGGNLRDMVAVLLNGNQPYIAITNYGAGVVVASAADTSCAINDRVGDQVAGVGANAGPYCGDNFQLAETEDLKFAYNLVATAFSSATYGKNVRRTGRSKEFLAPPLHKKWEKPIVPTFAPNTDPTRVDVTQGPTPAIYKNTAFVCAADMTIYALDCDPYSDMDMDGNPDDGEPGMNDPLNFWPDVLWKYSVSGASRLSSPTIVSVPTSNGGMEDIVYVAAQMTDGTQIIALRAFPMAGNRIAGPSVINTRTVSGVSIAGGLAYLPPTSELPPASGTVGSFDPGTLFALGARSDGYGLVVRLNALSLDILSDSAGEGVIHGSSFRSAPAIARIRDNATGATDLVVAATTQTPSTSGGGHLALYTYAVSNEQLVIDPATRSDQTGTEYFTRFAAGGPEGTFAGVQMRIATLPSGTPWLRLRYKDTAGVDRVWDPTVTPQIGTGEVLVNTSAPGKIKINSLDPAPAPDTPIFADYALDTVNRVDNPQANFKRAAIMPMYPGRGLDRPSGCGSVAVDVDGTFYFGTTNMAGALSGGETAAGSVYAVQFNNRRRPTVRWKASIPKISGDSHVAVGTPVIGDGVVYVVTTEPGGTNSNLLAFNTKKIFRYSPGSDVTLAPPISINQPDPFRDGVVNQPAGYTVDYGSGEITITDFGSCDVSLPFNVSDKNMANQTYNLVGGLEDFVSKVGIPGTVVDSPVMAGGVLYIQTRGGGGPTIWAVKTNGLTLENPVACRPDVRPGEDFRLDAGPAGAGGLVIVNGMQGIYGLYSPVTLVADNSRLIEIQDPAANSPAQVVWTCTNSYKLVPIKGGSQDGGVAAPRQVPTTFKSPSMVRRLNQTNMLVADTGNNRVVEIDRAGREVWEVTTFKDPNNLLAPGQPLSLNEPSDAIRWYSYTAGGNGFTAVMHTLIADRGNNRIISLRSPAPGGGSWTVTYHELEWVTETSVFGKEYGFRCMELLPPDATGARQLLAGIDNVALDAAGNELGDGSTLVVLDYNPGTRGKITEAYTTAAPAPGVSGDPYQLRQLSSVQRFMVPGNGPDSGEHILMADGRSVLDAYRSGGNLIQRLSTNMGVDPGNMGFQPISARQIATGEVVIVLGGDNGQVIRLTPNAAGGFGISPLAGAVKTNDTGSGMLDYLMRPLFADRAF